MIDETPGAGPDETTTPETAPETPGAGPDETTTPPETPATPAVGASSSPETPSTDAATADPPENAEPVEPVDDSEPEQPFAHGGDQVAEQVAHDEAQGFHGQEVDQTPNDHYTAPQGGDAEAPTPETAEGTDAA